MALGDTQGWLMTIGEELQRQRKRQEEKVITLVDTQVGVKQEVENLKAQSDQLGCAIGEQSKKPVLGQHQLDLVMGHAIAAA